MPSVSVVIPTLNAGKQLEELLSLLGRQTLRPTEIIVVDSESADNTVAIAKNSPLARAVSIRRKDFNHGATRHEAFLLTSGEFVCFLTQDAVPADDRYLENLIEPMLSDGSVALVSGRQLPKGDARRFEQLVREFNYPNSPSVKSKDDLPIYGIKTFFASDVCSAYRRDTYLSCGGFSRVNTNEDMLMAARLISLGYKVAYEPSARVYHSHNLSPRQQFERNREVGKFLEEHSDDLMHASEIGEGGKLVKHVASTLIRERRIGEFFAFGIDCSARLLGNRAGRIAARRACRKG